MFAEYGRIMCPIVNKAQKLPPGAPAIANPQTALGISVLNNLLRFVNWSGLASVFGRFASPQAEGIELPNCDL